MPPTEPAGDWRDGFLVLGNELSLDFLNTRPVVDGQPMELLPDAAAVLRWLRATGTVDSGSDSLKQASLDEDESDLVRLREFREEWRQVVLRREAGLPVTTAFQARLNGLLADYPVVYGLSTNAGVMVRSRRFEPRRIVDVFAPIVDNILDILTKADPSRVRKCDNCELQFHDTSKKGTRRWCSMQICGNRAKVAAYARRQKAATA